MSKDVEWLSGEKGGEEGQWAEITACPGAWKTIAAFSCSEHTSNMIVKLSTYISLSQYKYTGGNLIFLLFLFTFRFS